MYLSYEVNEKGFFSIVSLQLISFYPKCSSTLQGINYLMKKHQDTHLCSLSLCLSTSHSHLGFFLSSSSSAYLPSPFSLSSFSFHRLMETEVTVENLRFYAYFVLFTFVQ